MTTLIDVSRQSTVHFSRSRRRGLVFLLALVLQVFAVSAQGDTCGTPSVGGLTYQSNSSGVGTVSVTYGFPDANSNNFVQLWVDGVNWTYSYTPQNGTWTTGLNTTCWTTGPHSLYVVAVSCGRWSDEQYKASVSTTIDVNTTPVVNGAQYTDGGAGSGTMSVHYEFPNTASVNDRWLQLWVDGQNYSTTYMPAQSGTFTTTVNTACMPTGNHSVEVLGVACNRWWDQPYRATTSSAIPVDTTPHVSGFAASLDDSGNCNLTASYEFPNTVSNNDRWLQLWIDGQERVVNYLPTRSGTWTYSFPTTCMTNGAHAIQLLGVSCNKWADPLYRDLESTTVTVNHEPKVSITGFEEKPEGTYAKIKYEFPQTNTALQRQLELRRSHSDALIATTQPAQRTGTWEVLLVCDPGVPVYATAKACSDAPVRSNDAMPPQCELSCKLPAAGTPAKFCCIGDPVHTSSGNMEFVDQDPLPGGMVAPLHRTYQSRNLTSGAFGSGWTTIMDARATALGGTDGRDGVFLILEDGRRAMFRRSGGVYVQTYPEDSTAAGTVVFDAVRNGFVHRDSGSPLSRVFRASDGRLVALVDSQGDETILTYDSNGKAMSVADQAGRWSWSVSYGTAGFVESISVAGEPGLVWTYAYTAGKLATVTAPGISTWRTYVYSAAGLEEIRDARGAVTERHEYDGAGRARSSFGPSGEFTDIQFNLAGRVSGESRTHVVSADGKSTDYYSRFIAGKMRTVEVAGSCNCGSDDSVFALDDAGHVLREQNSKGWVTVRTFAGGRVATTSTFHRPGGCDPQTDTSRCRQTPDSLATVAIEPTAASVTTTFAYGDPNWPDRATLIATDSVVSGQQRQQALTFDPVTGAVLTQTSSGFDPITTAPLQRTTQTTLYNGTEGAAFDPCAVNPSGCAFSPGWLALPQPGRHTKSVNGPRTDAADVSEYVYYPIDNAVPPSWRGQLAAVRNAAGHVVRQEDYDLFGNARRVVSTNGSVTRTTYDLLGRNLTNTVEGMSGCDTTADALCGTNLVSRRLYDPPAGALAIQIGSRGEATSYTYDSRGRTVEVVRGEITGSIPATATAAIAAASWFEKMENQYSPATGRKTSERTLGRENGSWVQKRSESFAYDNNGRLTVATHGNGTSVQYAYEAGELQSVQDENHTSPNTFYSYDAAGRIATVRQTLASASGGEVTTSYAYDRNGNLTSVTDPNGNVTSYLYDDFGQMLRQVSPVSGQTSYGYDAAGQLLATTDANGSTTTRTYDLLGRVLTSSSVRNGDTEALQWTYDAGTFGLGRLSSMTDPTGSTSYSYDRRGLLLGETRAVGSATYTTSYGYDASGNRTRITYPSGRMVDTTFDYAGRPVSATTGSTPIVTSATYLPFGPATAIAYGNGTTRTMSYDQRYRPLLNELATQAGALARYAYGYDAIGNVTSLHDELDHAYDRNFAYDDLSRLTQANTGSALWGTGTYAYDAMGNLQSSQLGAKSRSFAYQGILPKLTSVTEDGMTRPVTYDSAGNELIAGATTSAYSPRNHMVNSNGFSYGYDGRGVRSLTSYPSHYLSTFTLSPATLYPNQSAAGTVTLGGPAPAGGAVVELTSSSTSIVVPATVSVGEGSTTAVFGITQFGTPAAGTTVAITAKYGFTRQATVSIGVAPALASMALNPTEVMGGQQAEGTIVLEGPAPAGGAVIRIDISAGAASAPTTVSIPEGAATGSFAITTSAVASAQNLAISAVYGNTLISHLNVRPPAIASFTLEPAAVMGGRPTAGLVTLEGPAPAGGATVALTSSNPSIATVSPSVIVAAGQTTQMFTIATAPVVATTSVTIGASHNGARSATLTVTPCVPAGAPPPSLGTETVWVDDQLPAGAVLSGPTQWDPSQKAGGSQSLTRPALPGANVVAFYGATETMPLTWGESVVFYMLISECAPPSKVYARWEMPNGTWKGVAWGETTPGHTYMGPVPAGGGWIRVEVPASVLGLEAKAISGFHVYVYDGQAWIDRIGKSGGGCYVAAAPLPTLGAETAWIDDGLPAGANLYGTTQWDASQKASGSQSLTRPGAPGENVFGVVNATATMSVTWGESLVFYILTNECMPPVKLLAQWGATDGTWGGAAWGQATGGHLYMGPMPTPGVWTRVEIPASQLNLETKSIRNFAIYAYDGQAWVDRIGKGGEGCYVATAPPPTLGAETVWVEDGLPGGANLYGTTQWNASQKASGSQSLTRPGAPGENVFGVVNATSTMPVAWGESLVFYVLTNECMPPGKLLAQWSATDGTWGGAAWGQATGGHVFMGAMPSPGVWTRVEIPASQLNLEAKSIKDFVVYSYDGQSWVDRIGKKGEGCNVATAPPPPPGSGETIWVDDQLPAGANAYGPVQWDPNQKASGSASITRPKVPGESVVGFVNATLPVTWGENLVFYVLTNECDPPRKLVAEWSATDGTGGGVTWGESHWNYPNMGPVPAGGTWTRIEIPAALLNLEGKSIGAFLFYSFDGGSWIDRIGKSGEGCNVATAPPPPPVSGDTAWVDDQLPAGATAYGPLQWDPSQKASGSTSITRPKIPGESVVGFVNATLPVTWDENLVFYVLTNECDPPRKLVAEWGATDGTGGGVTWGESHWNYPNMGPVPAGGTWTRVEVPAALLNLEAKSIGAFLFYSFDGGSWIDRIGKGGEGCNVSTAPPPPPASGDTVWVEDQLPAGATAYGRLQWTPDQKASGSASITRPKVPGESVVGFVNATATMPAGWGQSLVFYVLTNECDPPRKLVAEWSASDGTSGGVTWGESHWNYPNMGPVPAGGTWTRIEVPAALLNLEGKSISSFLFYSFDGGSWIDRIGTAPTASPLTTTPEASTQGLMDRLRARFDSWSARPRISLGISANYVMTTSSSTDTRRISLYTPELQLMAETEASTEATPPIAHEYVWFGGQPVAQIATATGEVSWYFNDHLGTPILQTDASASVNWRAEYEPFGNVFVSRTGSARHQPLLFPGQEEEGDLSYNIFRWYRASLGRYTQVDPYTTYRRIPNYSYALNRPTYYVDPLGLYEVKGFPPGLAEDINKAMQRIQQTLQKTPCCTSEVYKDKINEWLNDPNLVIEFNPKAKVCAHVNFSGFMLGMKPVITVGPNAFTGKCCYGGLASDALASTLFHEMGHFEGGMHDLIEPEEAKCFGCLPAP
jgi:RHS repeat-associated protein